MQDLSLKNAAKEGISLGWQNEKYVFEFDWSQHLLPDMVQINNGVEWPNSGSHRE